jgi:tetratricopeptide (TPR) repeat protein
MVIGALSSNQLWKIGFLSVLALAVLEFQGRADDQIKKKDGTVITGQIVKVSGGQVFVNSRTANGGTAQVPYYLTDIQSVVMTTPAQLAQIKEGAAPAAVVATVEPLVKEYAGLPADWVVDAMAQLAEAYGAQGKGDLADATYNQINQLYPGSPYQIQAVVGKAKLSLQHGKVDEAVAVLQTLIDKANQNLSPSPAEGRLYANAFLVYGQALEAQKKLPQALEAYLTIKTLFYQNPVLVDQANQLAGKLRQQNPGLSID